MSIFDIFRTQRDLEVAKSIEIMTAVIQAQADVIAKLTKKVQEDRRGIIELSELVAFILKQQSAVTQYIEFLEAIRQGKTMPSIRSPFDEDDDLIN